MQDTNNKYPAVAFLGMTYLSDVGCDYMLQCDIPQFHLFAMMIEGMHIIRGQVTVQESYMFCCKESTPPTI